MRLIFALALFAASVSGASAQYGYGNNNPSGVYGSYGTGSNPNSHYVNPYTRSDGTYVAPHYQTNPNNTQYDNYGTRGNYNPYTGQYGTHSPRY
ncbi:MAG TPA: hypothetical protein VFA53_07065 [Xanthobacteraceae bacterium]|nr:hypothetical protein [Xanthobacteraceae bacterium]